MYRTPPHHVVSIAHRGKDFPRKVGQCSSWIERVTSPIVWVQFQDLQSLTAKRLRSIVQGDLTCSLALSIILLLIS